MLTINQLNFCNSLNEILESYTPEDLVDLDKLFIINKLVSNSINLCFPSINIYNMFLKTPNKWYENKIISFEIIIFLTNEKEINNYLSILKTYLSIDDEYQGQYIKFYDKEFNLYRLKYLLLDLFKTYNYSLLLD